MFRVRLNFRELPFVFAGIITDVGVSLPKQSALVMVIMRNDSSECKSCRSTNLADLTAEVCIHFPGLIALAVEPVFAFPKLKICLDCGFIESNLSKRELRQLKERHATT